MIAFASKFEASVQALVSEVSQGARISASQSETPQVAENIQGICATILQVNEISSSIAQSMGQQGSATQENASSVQNAAAGTSEVVQNIIDVTTATAQSGEVALVVLLSSDRLTSKLHALQGEVSQFIADVRAA